MGLFVKKTDDEAHAPLFSMGLEKTVLLVGLGNVGAGYKGTRHNIGFACVDEFASQNDFPAWSEKKDLKCQLTKQNIGNTRVILIKPTTYMNNSGEAVRAVQQFYKLNNRNLVVVHDELDISFGQIRMRIGGGSAGNNGIKSLIEHIGEDFARIRIGIGNKISERADSSDFVLGKFTKQEQTNVPKLYKTVRTLLHNYITNGSFDHDTQTFINA